MYYSAGEKRSEPNIGQPCSATAAIGPNCSFVDNNNARPLKTSAVEELLESEEICVEWIGQRALQIKSNRT
ncbi:hypothetical protein TNCV_884331 [Trichonephila clavipes]|nr:hypothetical protein TNCV_884331 [Trichonephila clavipes]